jgi:hypothetical protein
VFEVTYKANQVINLQGNSCIDIYKIPRAWDVTSFLGAILKETLGEGWMELRQNGADLPMEN